MLRRLIEQKQRRLLRQRTRQNHPLFFSARKLIHPTVAQFVGAHLCQRISGQQAIRLGFKTQPLPIGIAPLQHVFPHAQRKQQFTFLRHQRDTLCARSQFQLAHFLAIHFHASRQRFQQARQ